jgi:hypothetical protein
MSNVMIGYLNLATLLASLPIIGAGLWLARGSSSSSSTTCSSILQTPLLAVGFAALLVSLAGFVGACFHVAWALRLYLAAVALLVAFLLGLTAFGFAVTAGGGGAQVYGRPYREYRVTDYSAWLQKRMQDDRYWRPALACVVGSKACPKIQNWTPMDYLQHDLTPIQVYIFQLLLLLAPLCLCLLPLMLAAAVSSPAAASRRRRASTAEACQSGRRTRTATGGTTPRTSSATGATRAGPA